jgi:hypothetical protein
MSETCLAGKNVNRHPFGLRMLKNPIGIGSVGDNGSWGEYVNYGYDFLHKPDSVKAVFQAAMCADGNYTAMWQASESISHRLNPTEPRIRND